MGGTPQVMGDEQRNPHALLECWIPAIYTRRVLIKVGGEPRAHGPTLLRHYDGANKLITSIIAL